MVRCKRQSVATHGNGFRLLLPCWESALLIDYRYLRRLTAEDLEHGGFGTREYAGIVLTAATWEWASRCSLRRETRSRRSAARAVDEHEFDQLAKQEGVSLFDPNEGPVAAPDFGMFATCKTCSASPGC